MKYASLVYLGKNSKETLLIAERYEDGTIAYKVPEELKQTGGPIKQME